jgi:hypothetical protein
MLSVGENMLEEFVTNVQKFVARKCVTSIVQKRICQEENFNVHSTVANSTLTVTKDTTSKYTINAQKNAKIMFPLQMKMTLI